MYFLSRWSKIGSVVEHEDLVTSQCCLGKVVSLCEICGHGLLHQYMKVAHRLHANLIVWRMTCRYNDAISGLCLWRLKKVILSMADHGGSWWHRQYSLRIGLTVWPGQTMQNKLSTHANTCDEETWNPLRTNVRDEISKHQMSWKWALHKALWVPPRSSNPDSVCLSLKSSLRVNWVSLVSSRAWLTL